VIVAIVVVTVMVISVVIMPMLVLSIIGSGTEIVTDEWPIGWTINDDRRRRVVAGEANANTDVDMAFGRYGRGRCGKAEHGESGKQQGLGLHHSSSVMARFFGASVRVTRGRAFG